MADDDKDRPDLSPNQARVYRDYLLTVPPARHHADVAGAREGTPPRMGRQGCGESRGYFDESLASNGHALRLR